METFEASLIDKENQTLKIVCGCREIVETTIKSWISDLVCGDKIVFKRLKD